MRVGARRFSNGDTIVEVMFAIAVFALLAVSCLAIMNRGIETTMRSLEITQVRQVINDQAELLRYAQQDSLLQSVEDGSDASGVWATVLGRANTTSSSSGANNETCADSATIGTRKPFVLYLTASNVIKADTTAKKFVYGSSSAAYPGVSLDSAGNLVSTNGVWVEAVSPTASSNFVDFYIRACWAAPGSDVPVTLGTIVRLYKK